MAQTLEQGDIFGRIGKAFGEGAASQFERGRVAKALEPRKGEEFNPLTTTQRLIRANASPAEISSYLPLIQQAQERKEAFPVSQSPNNNIAAQTQPSAIEKATVSPISEGKAFKPKQNDEASLWARASELHQQQPTLYRDPNTAYAKALSEYKNEQDILNNTEKQFTKSLEKRAQKYGIDLDQSLPGNMQQDYLRQAQAMAASGKKSPEKAADELSSNLLDFLKARTNLKSVRVDSLLEKGAKQITQSNINAIRKAYQDADQLELFENDLINEQGLSTPVASLLAFPIKDNKEINNFAHDTKKISHNPFGAWVSGLKEKGSKGTKKRTEQEIGEFVASHLDDNDSLNSIAMAFNAKGYDGNKILDVIEKNPKVRLNDRQKQDLQKRTSFRPSMKDILFFSSTGLPSQEIIP